VHPNYCSVYFNNDAYFLASGFNLLYEFLHIGYVYEKFANVTNGVQNVLKKLIDPVTPLLSKTSISFVEFRNANALDSYIFFDADDI